MHHRDPIAFDISRVYAQIRGAALQLPKLNYIPQEIFVYWPCKGPSQHRESKIKRADDVFNDPSFCLPDLSDDEEVDDESQVLQNTSAGAINDTPDTTSADGASKRQA